MPENTEKYNIICFSNQLWDFPNWTNKKHVMTRLARAGHTVLFVDPPINVGWVFFKQLFRRFWGVFRILTQVMTDSETGAIVFTPLNILPFSTITSRWHMRRIRRLAKKRFSSQKRTLLWVYHVEMPQLKIYLDNISYDLLIYDCVDNYESFPRYKTESQKNWIKDQEQYLVGRAGLVFATTPLLVEKLKAFNVNVHFTPNVGDYEKFKDAKKVGVVPKDLEEIPRPRVGFAGALDTYKFDTSLMEYVAVQNPRISFVLIGQLALTDSEITSGYEALVNLPNVFFTGARSYMELHNYYAGFDAYIIPYVLNDYTVGGCFPVKFHDALAAGLPTIVTDLPSYAPFKEVCYIAKTREEFSNYISNALEEDNEHRIKARQEVASENSWDGKVKKLLDLIAVSLPTLWKVSAV